IFPNNYLPLRFRNYTHTNIMENGFKFYGLIMALST
ncbi:MAG: hypothetical protein RIR48_2759, partial [Bacteroidota bacterium]